LYPTIYVNETEKIFFIPIILEMSFNSIDYMLITLLLLCLDIPIIYKIPGNLNELLNDFKNLHIIRLKKQLTLFEFF
jgi:hypothetical protein